MKYQTKSKLKKMLKSSTFWTTFVLLLVLILVVILYFADSERAHREKSATTQLSSEQMLADYDAYWTMLEENTFLLEQAPQANTIKQNYRKLVAENQEYLVFFQLLNDMTNKLSQVEGFHQLELYKYRMLAEERYAYQPICDTNDPWQAVYTDEAILKTYDNFNLLTHGVTHKKNETPQIEMTQTMANGIVTENVSVEILQKDVSVKIKLNDMALYEESPLLIAAYRNRFWDIYTEFESYQEIIFDISTVDKGSDDFWMDFIVAPLAKSQLSTEQYRFCKMGENNAPYLTATKTNLSPASNAANTPQMAKNSQVWIKAYSVVPSKQSAEFNGRITLLTSVGTKNAGENFAYFCKETGFAAYDKLKTSGVSDPFPLFLYKLPNSNFVLKYNPFYWASKDEAMH